MDISQKKAAQLLEMSREDRTATKQFAEFANANPIGKYSQALLSQDNSPVIEKLDKRFVSSLKKLI